MFLGPADLLLDFNWVVKSNPELFQECQNVIPPACLQEELSSQGHGEIESEGGGGKVIVGKRGR